MAAVKPGRGWLCQIKWGTYCSGPGLRQMQSQPPVVTPGPVARALTALKAGAYVGKWAARVHRTPVAAWPFLGVTILILGWLIVAAPPWAMGGDTSPSGLTLYAADGSMIMRKGPVESEPLSLSRLPHHVPDAFVAIEDRRFWDHLGIDARGILRASWRNLRAGSIVEGGSTITQQYVKAAYLSNRRTWGRKLKEVLLALWVDAWMSKEAILGAYLSGAYFGDGAHGISAAAKTYFGKEPTQLTVAEAAMLAGLVKAPSRLAPTSDLQAAQERARLVLEAMKEEGSISPSEAASTRVARLRPYREPAPAGNYFADWVASRLPATVSSGAIRTTLEPSLQQRAAQAFDRANLGGAEAALVAMRPDGRVVAMLGGRSYKRSAYNRATQARRQPGSAFKLFVYLAAMRGGATADSLVSDTPLTIDGWSPQNADRRYRGAITMREAFAYSSNVAAVRLSDAAGRSAVLKAAGDLGVRSPMPDGPTLALGTGTMTLLELTAAYAAIAHGSYPVRPTGVPASTAKGTPFGDERMQLLDLLWHSANIGTGRAAALSQPTFGKTGTSQDGRDALFIGFAGDLVAGVWVGRDDNGPVHGSAGGKLPAAIWRDFMGGAPLLPVNVAPVTRAINHRGSLSPEPVREAAQRGTARREQAGARPRGKQKNKGKGKGRGRGKK